MPLAPMSASTSDGLCGSGWLPNPNGTWTRMSWSSAIVGGIDLGEPRLDGIQTADVGAGFVHAGTVVVADDLRRAALGRRFVSGGRFEDVVQFVLRRFSGLPAPAPARHRGRNGIVGAPGAVGEFVEVIAGLDFAVEVVDVDAVEGCLC